MSLLVRLSKFCLFSSKFGCYIKKTWLRYVIGSEFGVGSWNKIAATRLELFVLLPQ